MNYVINLLLDRKRVIGNTLRDFGEELPEDIRKELETELQQIDKTFDLIEQRLEYEHKEFGIIKFNKIKR